MRDDLLQPAFAIYNSPGVYALLLGSGVSRSAEIMTGWDIMRDLIKQIASALGEKIEGTPEDWYRAKFENEPGYDRLLEYLGRTPLDRRAILRGYFEPSEDDREEGVKLPTPAHKAIAWLVKHQYIRVILTTNFDRLIEMSLEAEGIVPEVISTDTDMGFEYKLDHSSITIIKIHGDYLDETTRNTGQEVAEYDPQRKQLLQRVFSNYGLIISGWSAEWDTALIEALKSSTPRFATYWSWYGQLKEPASQLIQARKACEIPDIRADELFSELQKMVEALAGTKQEPPLNVAIAVERTKKMLSRSEHIELDELFVQESERTYQIITSDEFAQQRGEIQKQSPSDYQSLWSFHYSVAEIPLHIAATTFFYENINLSGRIHSTLKRWTEQPKNPALIFRLFPSVLLMYSAGIAAVYRQKWEYLAILLAGNEMKSAHTSTIEPLLRVIIDEFLGLVQGNHSYEYSGKYLHGVLRPLFQNYIPSDAEYDSAFDLFETLAALIYLYAYRDSWMPPHSAIFTNRSWNYLISFWSKGREMGENWELLTSGLVGTDANALETVLKTYVDIGRKFRAGHFWSSIPDYRAIYKGENVSSE